jgi:hypothetical protein
VPRREEKRREEKTGCPPTAEVAGEDELKIMKHP